MVLSDEGREGSAAHHGLRDEVLVAGGHALLHAVQDSCARRF